MEGEGGRGEKEVGEREREKRKGANEERVSQSRCPARVTHRTIGTAVRNTLVGVYCCPLSICSQLVSRLASP